MAGTNIPISPRYQSGRVCIRIDISHIVSKAGDYIWKKKCLGGEERTGCTHSQTHLPKYCTSVLIYEELVVVVVVVCVCVVVVVGGGGGLGGGGWAKHTHTHTLFPSSR